MNSYEITTACSRERIGNYLIRWEIIPEYKGTISFYASDSPDSFNQKDPFAVVNAEEGVVRYITRDNLSRKFFLMVLNNGDKEIIAARNIKMDNIQNLRDLGGYKTKNSKELKWGKLFRASSFSQLSRLDSIRLDKLNIKTQVSLCYNKNNEDNANTHYPNRIVINTNDNYSKIIDRILQETMLQGDVKLSLQDIYLEFVDDHEGLFSKAFNYLVEEDHYPIILTDYFGKDQVGYISALILALLEVPMETIETDYLRSNENINWNKVFPQARYLSINQQETLTAFLYTDRLYLDLAFAKINKNWGNVSKYLEQKLNFDLKKQEKLKEILLY